MEGEFYYRLTLRSTFVLNTSVAGPFKSEGTMETKNPNQHSNKLPSAKVMVWDLPTRLFHWLLFVCVVFSFVTGNIGGNLMDDHMLSGYAILALLLFRLAWGFLGSPPSRFSNFVKGPAAVRSHLAGLFTKNDKLFLGHNPLGGWSILAMLLFLTVQVGTGLFATDDIFTQGPLHTWVSPATGHLLTSVHLINRLVLVVLITLHIFAILFYFFYKGENLLQPMITGMKSWQGPSGATGNRNLLAAVIFASAVLVVYLLVR
jgi:cytochrome b